MMLILMYPYLNIIINKINQKQHFRIAVILFTIYSIISLISETAYFASNIVVWVAMYFVISYIKKYAIEFTKNKKRNVLFIILGLIAIILQVVLTNFVGLKFGIFVDKVFRWHSYANPFYWIVGICCFFIALNANFYSNFINKVAELSLYAYLLHENFLFRRYTRPAIWNYLLTQYGANNIVLIAFIYAILLYIVVLVVSKIYKLTIEKVVNKISTMIYQKLRNCYFAIENKIVK